MSTSGFAELPLHGGHVPAPLLRRMKELGSLIARYIVDVYGPDELLNRLADPFWFQAFNNVIGMDWDSSGSTTVVLYVLKSVFPPGALRDMGFSVLGGKGRDAINLPSEASLISDLVDYNKLVDTSRFTAKIDSTALQDGYSLYIHGLLVSSSSRVLVIQQGMNPVERLARRYHILLEKPGVFEITGDPHSGVASVKISPALNLVDEESRESRRAIVEIVESTPVNSLIQDLYRANRILKGVKSLEEFTRRRQVAVETRPLERQYCPVFYRPVTDVKRVARVAELIKEYSPREFHELLLVPGLGPEAMRAIALVADLIYGYTPSLRDPTTHPLDPFLYAYAHGGKDGVPFKVRFEILDKTIEFFKTVINELNTGSREKEILLRNLSHFVRRIATSSLY